MQEDKTIEINGKANRYAIKKLINDNKNERETKKRVVSENWKFGNECFGYNYQINILKNINESNNSNTEITKIMVKEINKKIYNYKQQDLLKKLYDENKFLTYENVIKKLLESELKCRYCDCEMSVLYDVSREMKQWTVDRVDNDLGHNIDNYYLACLECNLKKRRRTDEKFLFTKKLNLVKQEN
jgi:hypothetical protein